MTKRIIELVELLNKIKATSSRTDKEQLLKNNKDNEFLKDVLKFVYNPYIVTGISSKKLSKKIKMLPSEKVNTIYELITYLTKNNTGRDIDIVTTQQFTSTLTGDSKEFIEELVTKSLKIGVTSNTLNKIFGNGFIPSFDVMLAEKYFDNEHKVKGDFILTEKLDGIRNILIKSNGIVTMFSRQGQPHIGFLEIENEAKYLPDNTVLDGEFILKNINNLNSANLYRDTVKVARKDGIKQNIIYHVFDILSLDDFTKGLCENSCLNRKKELSKLLNQYEFNFIKDVTPIYIGSDKEKISELLDKVVSEGKEGLMLNLSNSPYKSKRCSDILKIKKMHTVDLKIVGFEEGEGKYKGTLGRMNVEYKGFVVGVGSGFTDKDRGNIWDNQEQYLGRIAEIQYFEESSNQNGGISLRFPVFKIIREIGKEVSYN